mgnify:CR=1 FL=1
MYRKHPTNVSSSTHLSSPNFPSNRARLRNLDNKLLLFIPKLLLDPSPQTITIFLSDILKDTTQPTNFQKLLNSFLVLFPPPPLPDPPKASPPPPLSTTILSVSPVTPTGVDNVVQGNGIGDDVAHGNGIDDGKDEDNGAMDEDNGTIDEDNGTCKDDKDNGIGNVYENRRWHLHLVYENRPQHLYFLEYNSYARYLFPVEERPYHLQYLSENDPAVQKYLSAKGMTSTRPIPAQPVQSGTVPPRSHPGLYPPQPSA